MKPPVFEYTAVRSIDEAVAELRQHGDAAKLLAGGQSLLPILNMRLATPERLIDLNRVAELAYVRARDGGLAIGAMTRQRAVERSALAPGTCLSSPRRSRGSGTSRSGTAAPWAAA